MAWKRAWRFGIVGAAAALVVLAGRPSAAEACRPPPCYGGWFIPGDETNVPASLPDILWSPRRDGSYMGIITADHVELVRLQDGAQIPVLVMEEEDGPNFLIRPGWPLDPGQSYRLRGADLCGGRTALDPDDATEVIFSVGQGAPNPESLGSVTVGMPMRGPLEVADDGSCSVEVDAVWVDVDVELGPGALPWRQALIFETLVNDQVWRPSRGAGGTGIHPGGSWTGRGTDRLYAVCEGPSSGLSEGTHQVRFRATLPGGWIVPQTPAVEVFLDCGGADGPGGGDSGRIDPGGVPEGGDAPPPQGCDCASGRSGGAVSLAALLLALAARTRSRRREFPLAGGRRQE